MTSNLAFIRDIDCGSAVARQAGKLIARDTFLADIQAVVEQLPDRPYLINFCGDRYCFTVAWAAAMQRGQVTLLPAACDAAAVAALRADYPALYVLTDDQVNAADLEGIDAPVIKYTRPADERSGGSLPSFPPDQVAAVLFTSGSTGRPNPSPRLWGRLVAGSIAAGAALGIDRHRGAALVSTVPHAHSYGLESAIVLPLQHALLLTAERPFFPSDVTAALDGERPGILVTTPVHLRALIGDATAATNGPPIGSAAHAGFVLSATASLSAELASLTETLFRAPVFEIYGCSEAGQLATRRTTDGPVWRCLQGFSLRQTVAGTWVSGPDEHDVLLADEIELTGDHGFVLQGRTGDLINVAGKRGSLADLTRRLMAIDGVQDGVFLVPANDGDGTPARLAALVVAPGLDASTIMAALRERIDPAFLPRPLRVVDALPRNLLGKLPRTEMLRLLESGPPDLAPADPIMLRFAVGHPACAGHFPGDPIIPGAVLLDELVAALFPAGWSGVIESAKFHHPVRPGDAVAIDYRTEGNATRFEGRLRGLGKLVISGALRSISLAR